jgi:hypothetical protein
MTAKKDSADRARIDYLKDRKKEAEASIRAFRADRIKAEKSAMAA